MKKWNFGSLISCPAFLKRLWCQLAISYTLLAFVALTLIVVMLFGVDDYKDYRLAIQPDHVGKVVASEKLIVAQAILDHNGIEWQNKAVENIREKLMNIEYRTSSSIYRITNSSLPEVYIQITNANERLVISDPIGFSEEIAVQFTTSKLLSTETNAEATVLANGSIWVDMPIMNEHEEFIGRLHVLFTAEFNLWTQIKSVFGCWLSRWTSIFLCSVPIGIACGLIASRYVTRQLEKMNKVTESWRQGNFEARIALPNDDVLIQHSRHLNAMAQDLEMYLKLKQSLAVSDERNRLARELHDTVKQKLFALGLQLAVAKTKPAVMDIAGEHILEAEVITRETQHDLMEIITQLRPSSSNKASLRECIDMIAIDFRRRFHVDIKINFPDTIQLDSFIEHHVLRIVQESLMNAVRHGEASKIIIIGKLNDNNIAALTITDNGSGFDVNKQSKGFGITSMHERARALPHGILDIKSSSSAGTQITISWQNKND